MQIYTISGQTDISYIGYTLSEQGEILSLMVRRKQTHWSMLAHRTTINATVFRRGLMVHLLLCILILLYDKQLALVLY